MLSCVLLCAVLGPEFDCFPGETTATDNQFAIRCVVLALLSCLRAVLCSVTLCCLFCFAVLCSAVLCSVTFCCAAFGAGLLYCFPVGGGTSNQLTISRVVLGVLSCVLLRYVMLPLVLCFLLCCAVVCYVTFCCAVLGTAANCSQRSLRVSVYSVMLAETSLKELGSLCSVCGDLHKNSVAAFRFLSSRFWR